MSSIEWECIDEPINFPRMIKTSFLSFATLALTLAVGCSARDSNTNAPTLEALELSDAELVVGNVASLTATAKFSDPEADVIEALIIIDSPSVRDMVSMTTPVSGGRGQLAGTVSLLLQVQPPEDGDYLLRLRLRDADGNDSNEMSAAFAAH